MKPGDSFVVIVAAIWSSYEAIAKFGKYGIMGVVIVWVIGFILNFRNYIRRR